MVVLSWGVRLASSLARDRGIEPLSLRIVALSDI
jgi:hypothetical protein